MSGQTMPEPVRRVLLWAAVGLAAVAAVGNFGHVRDFASRAGQGHVQAVVAALLPDVLLIVSVIRLRYLRRSAAGWVGLIFATGFVGWASVAMAGDTITARVVSVVPILVAVIAACLIEAKPAPKAAKAAPARATPARTPAKAGTAPRVDPPAAPTAAPAPTGPALHAVAPADPDGMTPEERVAEVASWDSRGTGYAVMVRDARARWGVSETQAKRYVKAARAERTG